MHYITKLKKKIRYVSLCKTRLRNKWTLKVLFKRHRFKSLNFRVIQFFKFIILIIELLTIMKDSQYKIIYSNVTIGAHTTFTLEQG